MIMDMIRVFMNLWNAIFTVESWEGYEDKEEEHNQRKMGFLPIPPLHGDGGGGTDEKEENQKLWTSRPLWRDAIIARISPNIT